MIDVALSSCGRVSMLEETLLSFVKNIKTDDNIRTIICEDIVDDDMRQEQGRLWISANKDKFDAIVYAKRKLTYVYCFSEILKHVESDYFFRLEDDVSFTEEVDIDPLVQFLKDNPDVCQVIFRRNEHPLVKPKPIKWDGKGELNESKFCSIATGVYNLKAWRDIIAQTEKGECHETSVLTPIAAKLGYRCVVVDGVENKHSYIHVGKQQGYNKGKWK